MVRIHIVAGLLSLIAGALALVAAKGSPLHRRSGWVFAIGMLTMTSTAVTIALLQRPNPVNVVAGLLTFHLVTTALLTVKCSVAEARAPIAGLMLVAAATAVYATALGFEALANGSVGKVPAPPIFMFAVVGGIAALLDARLLWAGRIDGAHRLARHLWRMTFAMWIATTSFFLGQAKFFPAALRTSGLLAVPVLLVLLILVYWLIRVHIKKRPRISPAPIA